MADERNAATDFEFDRATAITASGSGRFAVEVDPGFTVGPKPNGGYLMALLARAAVAALSDSGVDQPDPLAATAHYLRAPDPGSAEVSVEVLRPGRSASQVRASLQQAGKLCVESTFTLGSLPSEPADAWWTGIEPPAVAPVDDCVRLQARRDGMEFVVSILDRTETRLDPVTLGFADGRPAGKGVLAGWIGFADGRPVDPIALLFFLDALPPATFDLSPSGWVPTLSLSAYVRSRPAPGPLRIIQRAQSVGDGRVDEVCEIWDGDDRLVAQATQLAAIRLDEGAQPPGARPV